MRMLSERQTARSVARFGKQVKLRAELDVTPAGLLSIGVLVCGILLSTTVLVGTSIRETRRSR
jgi:hypothetical protein